MCGLDTPSIEVTNRKKSRGPKKVPPKSSAPSNNHPPSKKQQSSSQKPPEDALIELAEWLHKTAYIYALYGFIDGVSCSYSMVKYCFDLITDGDSSDVMHDWMLTPIGIASVAKFSTIIIGFSLLANIFSEDDPNAFKRYIAICWPYVRDTLKGLKNGYKGVRSALQAMHILSGSDLRHLILPVGVALGVLSVINRLFMRGAVVGPRKRMMDSNSELLKKIQDEGKLDPEACARERAKIQRQSKLLRGFALLGASYGGVVDGLYLYLGAMGLASLTPPLFVAMAVLCTFYTIVCIATRIYEEYDFQRRLEATEAQIELALCGKELEWIFEKIQAIPQQSENIEEEQKHWASELDKKLEEFEQKRAVLRSKTTLTYLSAGLGGLKNGLAAYGAVASLLFAIATVNAVFFTPFPPLLMVVGITLGLVFLVSFLVHALVKNYQHLSSQKVKEAPCHEGLNDLLVRLKRNVNEVSRLKPAKIERAIRGGQYVDASPQYRILEGMEIARSIFSGSKGSKAASFVLNPLQELNAEGHYQESPALLGVMAFSVMANASILGLRALAKGFGRPARGVLMEKIENTKIDEDSVPPSPQKIPLQGPRPSPLDLNADSQNSSRRSAFSRLPASSASTATNPHRFVFGLPPAPPPLAQSASTSRLSSPL